MTKVCTICGAEKDVSGFYRNRLIFYPYCKVCYIEKSNKYRANNLERLLERSSERSATEAYKTKRKRYLKSKAGKEAMRRSNANQKLRYPERYRARRELVKAIERGILVRKPCVVCGTEQNVQGHHEDYSKPLDIIWYCRTHHIERHKQIRKEQRVKHKELDAAFTKPQEPTGGGASR